MHKIVQIIGMQSGIWAHEESIFVLLSKIKISLNGVYFILFNFYICMLYNVHNILIQ